MSFINQLLKLNDCPLWYVFVLVLSVPVLYLITKKRTISVLIPYVLLLIGETLIFRNTTIEPRIQAELFWSYREWGKYWFEILANIVAFIPLGFMLYKLLGWKGIILVLLFSVGIELIQLVTHRGWFEFDDIFNNSLGTIFGSVPLIFIKKQKRKNN